VAMFSVPVPRTVPPSNRGPLRICEGKGREDLSTQPRSLPAAAAIFANRQPMSQLYRGGTVRRGVFAHHSPQAPSIPNQWMASRITESKLKDIYDCFDEFSDRKSEANNDTFSA